MKEDGLKKGEMCRPGKEKGGRGARQEEERGWKRKSRGKGEQKGLLYEKGKRMRLCVCLGLVLSAGTALHQELGHLQEAGLGRTVQRRPSLLQPIRIIKVLRQNVTSHNVYVTERSITKRNSF